MNASFFYSWLFDQSTRGFFLRVLVFLPLLTVLTLLPLFKTLIEQPLISGVARSSHVLVNLLGAESRRTGSFIHSSEFSVQIVSGCTGIFVYLIFLVTVVAFPVRLVAKLRALVWGAVLIFVLNQIRIVCLFFVGREYPQLFENLHLYVWQGIVLFAVAVYWYLWAEKASRADLPPAASA